MQNVNQINLGGINFPIEDTTARLSAQTAQTAALAAQTAANEAITEIANGGGVGSGKGNPAAPGKNLGQSFLADINAAQFSGNVWAWIQARIRAGNFDGISIGDAIQFTTTDGHIFMMEVAGINTYKNYGDVAVGNHIDFISRDLHPTTMRMNPVNYNNGISTETSPWLASELYHRLNSLQGNVPNATGAGGTPLLAVDFRTTGVWDKLPAALQAVIVQKRLLLPTRFSAGNVLIDDNSWAWKDAGRLWVPSEMEVYGTNGWGSLIPANPGWSTGGFQQYAIFAHNMRRVKGAGHEGARAGWWLLSARGGYSTHFCYVVHYGNANGNFATAAFRAPLCFRIA